MNITKRALVAAGLGLALLAPIAQPAGAAPLPPVDKQVARQADLGSVKLELTAAEEQAWTAMVSTAEGRGRVVTALREAFDGTLVVGTSAVPGVDVHTDLATGVTGDHFWIIASYADVVNGAITAGVAACTARLPGFGWLCSAAGNLIRQWAAGWGSAANHGVWAEVYWLPPHINAGRW